jgi:LysM repeat protein
MANSFMRVGRLVRSYGPYVFGVLGLSVAVWASWLNLARTHTSDPLHSSIPTQSENDALAEATAIPLPAFPASAGSAADVTRRIDLDTVIPKRPRMEVVRYTVQPGDSVFGIADHFGIKPETVLWGNYDVLNDDPHLLKPGQELNILPVDGVYYQWKDADTLQGVADRFGAQAEDIVDFPGNHLDPFQPDIAPGTWLVIPGGHREFKQWLVPTIARGHAGVGAALGAGGCSGDFTGGAVGTGGFIWPSANHFLSGNDFWSGHLAIDIAAALGDPVWAADSGVIVFAGPSAGGYGNMVMIDHGNGWQTLYGHLSQVLVHCGQSVAQGQTIGLAGSTGNSTGAHLHFETRFQGGFINPWFVLP